MKSIPPWNEERTLVTKSEDDTDQRFGTNPMHRSLKEHIKFGLINLDKPSGPSSHEVASWVKKQLHLHKVGHGGTLDPKVTGVLPIALENATKAVQAFLLSGKEYIGLIELHTKISDEEVLKIMLEFTGEIYQLPPVRSSVKRAVRRRVIYSLKLLEKKDKNLLFRVSCQSGTYIRKLCYDIGEVLGGGAHMKELRRIRSGPFNVDKNLVTMADLAYAKCEFKEKGDEEPLRKLIQPVEAAFEYIPKIYVRDTAVDALCHGAFLAAPGIVKLDAHIKKSSDVAIFTLKEEVVAIGKALMSSEDILNLDKGITATIDRVIMPVGAYPKGWKEKKLSKTR